MAGEKEQIILSRREVLKKLGQIGLVAGTASGGLVVYTGIRAAETYHQWSNIQEANPQLDIARVSNLAIPRTIYMLGNSLQGQIDYKPGTKINRNPEGLPVWVPNHEQDGRHPIGRSIVELANKEMHLQGEQQWKEELLAVNNTGLDALEEQIGSMKPSLLQKSTNRKYWATMAALDTDAITPEIRERLMRDSNFFFQPDTFATLDSVYDAIPQKAGRLVQLMQGVDHNNRYSNLEEIWLTMTPPLDNVQSLLLDNGFDSNDQPIIEQYFIPDQAKFWLRQYQRRVNQMKIKIAKMPWRSFSVHLLPANAGPRITQHLSWNDYERMNREMAERTVDEQGRNLGEIIFSDTNK